MRFKDARGPALSVVGLVMIACGSTAILHQGDLTLPHNRVLKDASLRLESRGGERTLILWYRTPTSIAENCQAIQEQAKTIWKEYPEPRAPSPEPEARSAERRSAERVATARAAVVYWPSK